MDKTAIGAATRGTEQEICKVRVQSTPEEISHFHELLDRCEELGLCNVINFSEELPFDNGFQDPGETKPEKAEAKKPEKKPDKEKPKEKKEDKPKSIKDRLAEGEAKKKARISEQADKPKAPKKETQIA